MKITQNNNFCRVFEYPTNFPTGFLFGGGKPVTMKMVDWFNPISQDDITNNDIKPWSEYVPELREFLSQKMYIRPNKQYIVVTNFNESFSFTGKVNL